MPVAGKGSLDAGIDTRELKALRRRIKAAKVESPQHQRALKAANKRGGEIIVAEARARLEAMGGQQAAAAKQVKAATSEADIKVRVVNSQRAPFALAGIWGAKRRAGWFARERYERSKGRQFKAWVGNGWKVGVAGEGPYGLGDAIAEKLPEVTDQWGNDIRQLMEDVGGT